MGKKKKVLSQMDLVTAIQEYLIETGMESITIKQQNTIINAANLIIDALEKPYAPAIPNQGLRDWLNSDETGISSKWMAYHLTDNTTGFWRGQGGKPEYGHPHDPSDLLRCVNMVKAIGSQKIHDFDKVAETSEQWKKVIENWDRWSKMLEEALANPDKNAYELFKEMQAAGL